MAQQSKDEEECYTWSRSQSGFDPAAPPQAAAGVLAGGRQARKNRQEHEKQQQTQAQASADVAKAAQQQKLDTFKRGITACLEARGYSVK